MFTMGSQTSGSVEQVSKNHITVIINVDNIQKSLGYLPTVFMGHILHVLLIPKLLSASRSTILQFNGNSI
jgi:hypothetical protein